MTTDYSAIPTLDSLWSGALQGTICGDIMRCKAETITATGQMSGLLVIFLVNWLDKKKQLV